MKLKLDNHIVVFQTNVDSDRIVIKTLTNHFKRVTVVQTLKDLCRLLVNKTSKVFLITGESIPNTLTSYYRALDAVSKYKVCDHRIVSLIPRHNEAEAYKAFRSGVIDDYLVARPVYEIHRVILICEHLLIQLGVAVNLKSNNVEFVEQIANVTPEVVLSIVKGMERKSALQFEFENCILEIDRALDSATEKIQLNQIVELDITKLKETLGVIRSNEIRPELLKLQQKAMDLLEHALSPPHHEETESDVAQTDLIKPNSQNHSFNKLFQQDVSPDSLKDDQDQVPTILVVEDDLISLQLTQKLLNNYKVKVEVAKSGRKAFAALTSQRYDLILLDVNLPDTNGIYIVGQISSGDGINSDTPIIMLSGSKDEATVSQAIKSGAKGYIIKPLYKDLISKLFIKYHLPFIAKN